MHAPWLEAFENIFSIFINITIHGLELMGVVVVVSGAISAFYGYFVRHAPNIRLSLAQSMAIGLEFKLGGEILRTVIARDWNEILTVGAIIVLRAALNFLLHWEIEHIQHDAEIIEHASSVSKDAAGKEQVSAHKAEHAINHLQQEGHITAEQAEEMRRATRPQVIVEEKVTITAPEEGEPKE